MTKPLRVFVSSPSDVPDERLRAALVVDKLAQDYSRFFPIETYRWEHEPMLASGPFQAAIEPPSSFDIVILILWSRLGMPLPDPYEGLDGRKPVTGTEWEYEDALKAARATGAPALLAFRNANPALIDTRDPQAQARTTAQLHALDDFWKRHFLDRGTFVAAYKEYHDLEEFARLLEEALRKLVEQRIHQTEAPEAVWMQAPFRGLEAYEFEHAPIFFGRDELVAKAAEQLASQARAGTSFLLVSGPSGSGKSSLVKAALVPRLMKPQRIERIAFLRRAIFRPGDAGGDLILAFVDALTRPGLSGYGIAEVLAPGQDGKQLAAHLRAAADEPSYPFVSALARLTDTARRGGEILRYEEARMVLIVDQLEELFTAERITPSDRELFVRLLAGLARSGAVWVVATMRADFWHRAAELPELMKLAEGAGRLEVGVPAPAELADMILKPAQAAGLSFETSAQSGLGLNAILANDAAAAPGVLPLLSFTLDALYREDVTSRHGKVLTFATYEALGKLEGAIARRANEVVAALPAVAQASLQRVLRALVTLSGGDQIPVARAASLDAFAGGTAARILVDALIAARLLVASDGGGNPAVRLAHEALIRRWDRARELLVADRRDLETRSLIESQMARWLAETGKARKQRLLRDPDLANAVDLERRWGEELANCRGYIAESVRADRARQRIFQAAAAAFAVLSVVSVLASYKERAERKVADDATTSAKIAAGQAQDGQRALSVTVAELRGRTAAEAGKTAEAVGIALDVLPADVAKPSRPLVREALTALVYAINEDQRNLATLSGHEAPIWSMAFSPDGTLLATGSVDKTVRIWDVARRRLLRTLAGQPDVVTDLAFTQDGKRLISVGGIVAIAWDVTTGEKLRTFEGHKRPIQRVTMLPGDRRFVTSAWDNTARIWNLDESKAATEIHGPDVEPSGGDPIMRAVASATFQIFGGTHVSALSPDGKRLVTAGHVNPTASVWDTETGRQVATLNLVKAANFNFEFTQAAFDRDGGHVATASSDGARIWDVATHKQLFSLGEPGVSVETLAFNHAGDRIVTGRKDGDAQLWDALSGKLIATLSGHTSAVNSVDFSADDKLVVTGAQDGSARIWDGASGRRRGVLREQIGILQVKFSPDGAIVASAGRDNTVRLWRTHAAPPEQRMVRPVDRFSTSGDLPEMAFSPDSKTAVAYGHATFGEEATATLLNLATRQRIAELVGANPRYTPDGRRIITTDPGFVRLYDAISGELVSVVPGDASDISPSSDRLAAVRQNTVTLLDTQSGAAIATLDAHKNQPLIRIFDPAGQTLTTISEDAGFVWNAKTGEQRLRLSFREPVLYAAVDPSSRFLLALLGDNSARLWRLQDGQLIERFNEGGAEIAAAAFSPDGRRIVTANADGTGSLWDSASGQKIDQVAAAPDRAPSSNDNKWSPFAALNSPERKPMAFDAVKIEEPRDGSSPFSADGSWLLLQSGSLWKPGQGIEQPSFADSRPGDFVPGQFVGNDYALISQGKLLLIDPSAGKAIASFGETDDRIKAFEADPASDRVVTMTAAGVARLWRLQTGLDIAELKHAGTSLDPTFFRVTRFRRKGTSYIAEQSRQDDSAPDFAVLTRGADASVKLWSSNGEPLAELVGQENPGAFDFVAGCFVVVQTPDSVRILDTATGRQIADLRPPGEPIDSVAILTTGQLLIGTGSSRFTLYRVSDGRMLAQFISEKAGDDDYSQGYAVGEQWILAVDKVRGTLLLNIETGETKAIPELPPDRSLNLRSGTDGRVLVFNSRGDIWLIDTAKAQVVSRLLTAPAPAAAVNPIRNRYNGDNDANTMPDPGSRWPVIEVMGKLKPRILIWEPGGKLSLFDGLDGHRIAGLEFNSKSGPSADWSVLYVEAAGRIAIRMADGQLGLWNSDSGKREVLAPEASTSQGIFNGSTEATFVSLSQDGRKLAIDAATGTILDQPKDDAASPVSEAAIERYQAAISKDGNGVDLVDRATGQVVFTAPVAAGDAAEPSILQDAQLSGDGRLLAVKSGSGASLWTVDPLKRVDLGGSSASFNQVVLGGLDRAITVSNSGDVALWQPSASTMIRMLHRHQGQANASLLTDVPTVTARFIGAGQRILINADGTAEQFNAATGESLGTIGVERDSIVKVDVDDRGQFFQTVATTGATRAWNGKALLMTLKEASGQQPQSRISSSGDRAKPLFTPDGKRLIAGNDVFDVATGKVLTASSNILAVSPDAGRLMMEANDGFGTDGQRLDIVDSETGDVLKQLDTNRSEPGPGIGLFTDGLVARSGDTLFTAEADRTIRAWDLKTGTLDETRKIKLTAPATALAATADRALLAIGTKDGRILVRPATGDRDDIALGQHSRAISFLGFNPDGKRLLAAAEDGKLELWDPTARQQPIDFAVAPPPGARFVFSPDGKRLAVTVAKAVALMDTGTGEKIGTVAVSEIDDLEMQFSSNSASLLLMPSYGAAQIVDGRSGASIARLPNASMVTTLKPRFSPDGRNVLAALDERRAAVWDASTGQRLFDLAPSGSELKLLAYIAGGQKILSVDQGGTLREWRANDGAGILDVNNLGSIADAVLSDDGKRLYVRSQASVRPRLLETESGREIARLEHGAAPDFNLFTADSRHLVTHASDNKITVWDASDGKPVGSFEADGFFAEQWSLLATASAPILMKRDAKTAMFRGDTGAQTAELDTKREVGSFASGAKVTVTMSAGAGRVLLAGDGPAQLWNGQDGSRLAELPGHVEPIVRAQLSLDGRRGLTYSNDHIAKLWNTDTGAPIASFGDDRAAVLAAKLSSRGDQLLLIIGDSTGATEQSDSQPADLILFNAIDGRRVRAIGKVGRKADLMISPDGRSAIATSEGDPLTWWDLDNGGRIARYDHAASGQFSPDGRYLAIGADDRVLLVTTDAARRVNSLAMTGSNIQFEFAGAETLLTSSSEGIRIWDTRTGSLLRVIPREEQALVDVNSSADGHLIAGLDEQGDISIWSVDPRQLDVTGHPQSVIDYARMLAAGGTSNTASAEHNDLAGWLGRASASGPRTCLSEPQLGSGSDDYQQEQEIAACERMLAEQPKSARYQYLLGRALAAAKRWPEAAKQYRGAAEAGEVDASYQLALMYLSGTGQADRSEAKAVGWLTQAAKGGHLDASAELAVLDLRQATSEQDRAAALGRLHRAADAGSPLAQRVLSDRALDQREPDLKESLFRLLVAYRSSSTLEPGEVADLENTIAATARLLPAPVAVDAAQKARAWAAR